MVKLSTGTEVWSLYSEKERSFKVSYINGYIPSLLHLYTFVDKMWRCTGIMVSVFEFTCKNRWRRPGLSFHVVSLDKKLFSTRCIN